MSQRFPITINDDGTVTWHGVDAGKTKVLAMNCDKKLIVLHVAGSSYWSGVGGQSYAGAHVNVHEYEEGPSPREIFLTELFGVMEYKPRGNDWRPKQ